jgi:hypothetical protein
MQLEGLACAHLVPAPLSRITTVYNFRRKLLSIGSDTFSLKSRPLISEAQARNHALLVKSTDHSGSTADEFVEEANLLLCTELAAVNNKLKVARLLLRVKDKPAMARWSCDQHMRTLAISASELSRMKGKINLILIDDISTTGGTISACEITLRLVFPTQPLIKLVLGRSRHANRFVPLF